MNSSESSIELIDNSSGSSSGVGSGDVSSHPNADINVMSGESIHMSETNVRGNRVMPGQQSTSAPDLLQTDEVVRKLSRQVSFFASDPSRTTESETLLTLTNDPRQEVRSLAINLRRFLESKIDLGNSEEKFLVAELQKCLSLLPRTQEFQNPSTSANRNGINPNKNGSGIQLPAPLNAAEENPTSNAAMDSNFTATHPNIDESRMQPASINEGFDETETEGSENSHKNEETFKSRSSGTEQSTRSIQRSQTQRNLFLLSSGEEQSIQHAERSQATDERKPSSNSTENKELFTKNYTILEVSPTEKSLGLAKSDQKRQNRKLNNYYQVWLCWLLVILVHLALLALSCSVIYYSISYLNEKCAKSPDDYIENDSTNNNVSLRILEERREEILNTTKDNSQTFYDHDTNTTSKYYDPTETPLPIKCIDTFYGILKGLLSISSFFIVVISSYISLRLLLVYC
ncbi:uncharacterized protein LOC134853688 [Symsagittifera roscoffensis]|uniref:uncharacterized protein LOC134853688 n=1 Tax=Symsagittifera roscoffensis TaxID=84072 RepID=UPI00307B3B50